MITGWVIGDAETIAKFEQMRPAIMSRIEKAMSRLLFKLQHHVVEDKIGSWKVYPGSKGWFTASWIHQLKGSINVAGPKSDGQSIWGSAGTNLEYANILEFGGRTAPHPIRAVKAKALAFYWTGGVRPSTGSGRELDLFFFKSVHHPGSEVRERRYLRGGLEDMRDEIKEDISAAVGEGLKSV